MGNPTVGITHSAITLCRRPTQMRRAVDLIHSIITEGVGDCGGGGGGASARMQRMQLGGLGLLLGGNLDPLPFVEPANPEVNAAAASNILGSIHCLEECAGVLGCNSIALFFSPIHTALEAEVGLI